MKHAPTILKEVEKRIAEYEMFAYDTSAKIAILELKSLKDFILNEGANSKI
ncbi:hypothetical protein [Paenibacillus oryzisoli]|uniref:hypothetical protein n=1 Tax=Paenibacillus oryzisoli TaxID=1850517 RepID=UPI0012FC40E6|nr:hypothetical protein [Paenibacillus oryzisoli]